MIKILLVLGLALVVLFALGYNVLDPDGYVNTVTEPVGVTPTWSNGNPMSQVTDPMTNFINSSLNTRWGFIIVLLIIALLAAMFRTVLIASFGFSYIFYIIGSANGFPMLSWLTFIVLFASMPLIWILSGGRKKTDKFKGIIKLLLGLVILIVIILYALTSFGFLIPGWNT